MLVLISSLRNQADTSMKALDVTSAPSPESPHFLNKNVGTYSHSLQSWSSERIPLTTASSSFSIYKRRQTSLSSIMQHHSGRTVPSKWEDAERWITSPSSSKSFVNTNRRPMSRSGPIGQSKAAYYSNYSPNFQGFQNGKSCYSLALSRSPISSGLMLESASHSLEKIENGPEVSAGVSGFSELLSESSSSSAESSQDAKLEQYVDGNGEVSRRDMATQMSPESSYSSSSSKGWPASASMRSQSQSALSANCKNLKKKSEEKDVHVDKWATVLKWPKRNSHNNKNGGKQAKRDPPQVVELYKTDTIVAGPEDRSPVEPQVPVSPWDIAAVEKKYEREEAKITAWQNLQKAKSEAAVRKLEMNLERKRSESMDKIIKKFKKAEKKSQKMRKILAEEKAKSTAKTDEGTKGSVRVWVPSPVSIHVGSFSCCFSGHGI